MPPRQKLELTWIDKDKRPRIEPRILVQDAALSYHAAHRTGPADSFDNRLVFGDNLLALKALEAEFTGQVKCVFIDPPYNTGSAFAHYDDGVEHSVWLSLMRERLELLRRLLRPDGSIWITLDDNEHAYCKVMCDEIFGRGNFVANVIWEKADSPRMDAVFFSGRHDNVLVYARDITELNINKQIFEGGGGGVNAHYNRVEKSGERYYTKPLRAMGNGDDTREARPTLYFPIEAPDGELILPVRQDGVEGRWRWGKERVEKDKAKLDWVKTKKGWSVYYKIYLDKAAQRPPETIWTHKEVGSNRTAKAEVKAVVPGIDPFTTPKPERLLHRILTLATNPGDLVLDSFAGSGTTGAVAHKMGRRWLLVELGEHCHTHIIPRLRKVIDGQDAGGVTAATGWAGGGGFRYYRLAPTLLIDDPWGRKIINKAYDAAMLAEAVCKLEGFVYAPSGERYWQQGHSSERDFVYVTTQTLTEEQLRHLSEDVGPAHTLLVCCAAWRGPAADFPNLTLKKLPQAVLHRCAWGHDDYSLNVANLAERPAPAAVVAPAAAATAGLPLFDTPTA